MPKISPKILRSPLNRSSSTQPLCGAPSLPSPASWIMLFDPSSVLKCFGLGSSSSSSSSGSASHNDDAIAAETQPPSQEVEEAVGNEEEAQVESPTAMKAENEEQANENQPLRRRGKRKDYNKSELPRTSEPDVSLSTSRRSVIWRICGRMHSQWELSGVSWMSYMNSSGISQTLKKHWRKMESSTGRRDRKVERKNFQISILGCTQRRSALKHLKEDRVKKFNYSLPYINNPFKEDESEQSTTVVQKTCEYLTLDNLEELADDLIKEGLLAGQKDEFMVFVKKQVHKAKKANGEAEEAREKAKAEMSEETKEAYKEMKLYKFYPSPSPDTPDISAIDKSSFINRYFGKAHEVL